MGAEYNVLEIILYKCFDITYWRAYYMGDEYYVLV